jgi:uncharacterized membrane protein YfcA
MQTILHLPDYLQLSLGEWVLAYFAAFIIGLAKAGIKGIGTIGLIILALLYGTKISTGIVLPMLVMADSFAVLYFRRHIEWHYLKKLIPWMVAGILIAVWIGKDLPESMFKYGMGGMILFSVILMFIQEFKRSAYIPDNQLFASFMGTMAGFATMIGNLAGPFTNVYFLAMRVPKHVFIGSLAMLFFLVNVFKVPFHIWSWKTITYHTFHINLALVPGLVIGLLAGIRIIEAIPEKLFRWLILTLTAGGAIFILMR